MDEFCGGGGVSLGIEDALGQPVDVAINHDEQAIAVHQDNHPRTAHFRQDVWKVGSLEASRGRPVGLYWASPDCRFFSPARGAAPISKGVRVLPFSVVRRLHDLRPRVSIVENVPAIRDWGPLDAEGRRIQARRGETFKAWVRAIVRLGYDVDWRILDSSDYGAPTRRNRFILIARCDGQPIVWPEKTHGPGLLRPIDAASCIDWTDLGRSIFGRRKDLAVATQRRIAEGYRRFVVQTREPFIVPGAPAADDSHADACAAWIVKNYGGMVGHDVHRPLGAITGKDHHSLAVAYLTKLRGSCRHGQDVLEPMPTLTGGGTHVALTTAFLMAYYGTGVGQDMREPMRTLTTRDRMGLVTIHGAVYQPVDFRFRMLRSDELLRAQFGRLASRFSLDAAPTHAAKVQMIGQSVPPEMVSALVRANVGEPVLEEAAA